MSALNEIKFTQLNQDNLNSIANSAGINDTDETILILLEMHPGQHASATVVAIDSSVVSLESPNDIKDLIEHLPYEMVGIAAKACHSRINRCYLATVEDNRD